jgi:hypothetical protein
MGEVVMELDFMWPGKQKFQLLIKPLPKLPLPLNVGQLIANFFSISVGVQVLLLPNRRPLSHRVHACTTPTSSSSFHCTFIQELYVQEPLILRKLYIIIF